MVDASHRRPQPCDDPRLCNGPRVGFELRHAAALRLVIVAWGVQAIITQTLLLREALVLMFGSELAWGVVLFSWLLGVAIGAGVGGWLASRVRNLDLALAVVLLALSGVACVELWALRGARGWLGVGPGELLSLAKVAVASVLFIPPAGALVGIAFPLACAMADGGAGRSAQPDLPDKGASCPSAITGAGPLGGVYALESFGSLIGGAAFSFWAVERLSPIEIALACAALTCLSVAWLLGVTRPKLRAAILFGALGVASLLACVLAGDALNQRLVERRWADVAPGYELRAEAESKYQNLAVGFRADQFTLYCDGKVSASFPDPYSFVPLAHFWMCTHPDPRRVLVLGGGAEGLVAEILRHPVEQVDYVETDARQIELIKPFLAQSDRKALTDARVIVHHVDARYFIKTQRDRFDLVIARLPEPTSALRARFYTTEFFAELRRAMRTGGVLCMMVEASPADLPVASAQYLASVRATVATSFSETLVGWGNPAHLLTSDRAGAFTTDPAELTARYAARGIQADLFYPEWFEGATDWFDPDKVQVRAEQLDEATGVEISTDLRPVVYLQRLILWESATSGPDESAGHLVDRLRSISLAPLVVVLGVIGVIVLAVYRVRGGSGKGWAVGAIVLSVATTGFVSMALSVVWLFAFQNLYGYVYQRIGWIIAVFMFGLVIGCWLVGLRSNRRWSRYGPDKTSAYLWRWLIVVDVLLAALALAVPFVLPALGAMQSTATALVLVEVAVSIMVATTGVLGGAAFALAGGLRFAGTGCAGSAAGSVVGADHAGACVGALITGILLVPVFGTATAAFVLVGMKLASAVVLSLARRAARAG